MAIECLGCSAGHAANAVTLYSEALKFERAGNTKMRDLHLTRFMGEWRQAEEQNPFPEMRAQMRGIRKKVEASIAANEPLPDLTEEISRKATEAYRLLREHPELCPSCQIKPEVEHEAAHG